MLRRPVRWQHLTSRTEKLTAAPQCVGLIQSDLRLGCQSSRRPRRLRSFGLCSRLRKALGRPQTAGYQQFPQPRTRNLARGRLGSVKRNALSRWDKHLHRDKAATVESWPGHQAGVGLRSAQSCGCLLLACEGLRSECSPNRSFGLPGLLFPTSPFPMESETPAALGPCSGSLGATKVSKESGSAPPSAPSTPW